MLKAAHGWGYVATKLDWETLFIPVEDAEKGSALLYSR